MGEKIYLAFYELSRLVIDCLLLNLLWAIVSWPVLFLTIQIGVTPDPEALQILLPLLFFFMPILLFPGLQALISSVREGIREPVSSGPVSFFKHYRNGYRNSFLIGMMYTGLIVLLAALLYFSLDGPPILSLIVVVLLFYIWMGALITLFIEAHYAMPVRWKLKQGIYFIMKHPLFSIGLVILLISLNYVIFSVSLILYSLIGIPLTLYAVYYLFLSKLDNLSK